MSTAKERGNLRRLFAEAEENLIAHDARVRALRLSVLVQAECERDLRLPEGWEPWVEVDDIEEVAP